MKLVYLASHPIQYHAPLFRALAERCTFEAWFAHRQDAAGQAGAGYGVGFDWDIDLLDGYRHRFLHNESRRPSVSAFAGCDVPEVGARVAAARPDALVVGGWNLKVYWQAIAAARRLRVPVFARTDSQAMPGDGWWRPLLRQALHRPLLRRLDGFLAAGTRSVAYLRGLGVAPERIAIVPHAVDVERFATARARRDATRRAAGVDARPLVVYAGRLVPMKRVDRLLAAAAALPTDACCIWVVGDGPLRGALERQAVGLPVRFLGFRNQSELPALLAAADLLVLPSERDTWGLVVNEMLAAGGRALVSESAGCAPDLSAFGPVVRTFATNGLAEALAASLDAVRDGADRLATDASREAALAWFAPGSAAEALLSNVSRRLPGRARPVA